MQQDIQLQTRDGQKLAVTAQHPDGEPHGAVVIASALGVPRKVYGKFAAYLAEQGWLALTFDYRGIGDSGLNGLKGREVRFADWGAQDTETALAWALQQTEGKPVFLVGNSCGGQLFGLAPSSERLAGAVFVAAQTAYWRNWPMPGRLQMGLMFNCVIPLLSLGNTFPARRIGLSSIDAPAGVTRQWARWGRLKRYLFDPRSGVDASRYPEFSFPVLAFGFADDSFAPAPAIEALCRELPRAEITRRQVDPADIDGKPIGHFGFFREKHRDGLWSETAEWMRNVRCEMSRRSVIAGHRASRAEAIFQGRFI